MAVPVLSIAATNANKAEGSNGAATPFQFTVTRTGDLSGTSSVSWDIQNGFSNNPATDGADFTGSNFGTLNFTAGQVSQTITVNVLADSILEQNEWFTVRMIGAQGATVDPQQATAAGIIQNDDATATPAVSVNDVTITEGNAGTQLATFTLTRTGGTGAFAVNFATADGTATVADGDYVARSGTLSFGANVNTQTVSVTINGDTKFEGNETFFLNLSGATNGATISDSQGLGIIGNDDSAPAGSIAINDVTITEGNAGTQLVTFTVTRTGGTGAFAVNFATADGSATVADGDYVARSGTLSFGANVNTQTVSVTINGDTKFEGNETFFVNLSGATNGATITDSQGLGMIANDDFPDLTPTNLVVYNGGVTYTVGNIGQSASAASTTGVYLSTDSIITAADTLLNTKATPALAAGALDFESVAVAFPYNLTAGNYFVGVFADHNGQIIETNESNNTTSVPVVLGDAGANWFTGTPGKNIFIGCHGDDRYYLDDPIDVVVELPGQGFDWVLISITYTLTISLEIEVMTTTDSTGRTAINLTGNEFAQTIMGNEGDNIIDGRGGNDLITGFGGNDRFIFAPGGGGDTITDFTAGARSLDALDLSGFHLTLGAALFRAEQVGSDTTVFNFGNGDTLTLQHVTKGSLSVDDFIGLTTNNDFNGDGTSDGFWRNDSTGHVGTWEMHNNVQTWHDLGGSGVDHKVAGIGDFNGDGTADLFWRNGSSGHVGIWEMHNNVAAWRDLGGSGVDHKVVGIGDFNSDCTSDVLWRNDSDGHVGIWEMHNNVASWRDLGGSGTDHKVVGIGDFNSDGTSDVLWRNDASGHVGIWEMHNNVQTWHDLGGSGVDHKVVGVGDFNGDGTTDVFWRNDSSGHVGIWEMHNNVQTWRDLGGSGTDHKVAGIGDFNGDGTSDVFWRNDSDGHVGIWEMHNNVQTWHDLGLASGVDHSFIV